MAHNFFKFYYQDDIQAFEALVESIIGSTTADGKRGGNNAAAAAKGVNRTDGYGRTVLHLTYSDNKIEFVKEFKVPCLDVLAADLESGWTALHKASYVGNIAIAQLLIASNRDTIRVKYREGNSPFDVLNSTIQGTNAFPLDLDVERVNLERPRAKEENEPAVERFRELRIRDVQLSKLHTVVLTTDPTNNLYICGFGNSGRLGFATGGTQFTFKNLPKFGNSQVIQVALGQDLVVTADGDCYSWGSNRSGQLGYPVEVKTPQDEPVQHSPRKIVAGLKREHIIGVAAYRVHSVAFTDTDLFMWGKNVGQLGFPTTEGSAVELYPPIDNATIGLLANCEVIVFINGGYFKGQEVRFSWVSSLETNMLKDLTTTFKEENQSSGFRTQNFWHFRYSYTLRIRLLPIWEGFASKAQVAKRFVTAKEDLIKPSSVLKPKSLSSAVYFLQKPAHSVANDLSALIENPVSEEWTDMVVHLQDRDVRCHSVILSSRNAMVSSAPVPTFAASDYELSSSETMNNDKSVDLRHVPSPVFQIILDFMYGKDVQTLLDTKRTETLTEFLDVSGGLTQLCEREKCSRLLAEADLYSAEGLKMSVLKYISMNLECMLENGHLGSLDESIMVDVEKVVREKQVEKLPISKSGLLLELLEERNPSLADARRKERDRLVNVFGTSLPSSYGSLPSSSLPSSLTGKLLIVGRLKAVVV
ncbi:hypothetical protein V1525DRAFT_419148 [Lipomyces kononenkoae]|uniref:Uncharacterized protein n=1 Tax=Lipomyces kononenkoae TaxID=34357 RepID=A0ACC3T2G5_LIPKO